MFDLDLYAWQTDGTTSCFLSCRGFPKKASRTARIASDEEIQGTKDAVIQDLERKLRFKEDLLNNGQPVLRQTGAWAWNISFPHQSSLTWVNWDSDSWDFVHQIIPLPQNLSELGKKVERRADFRIESIVNDDRIVKKRNTGIWMEKEKGSMPWNFSVPKISESSFQRRILIR